MTLEIREGKPVLRRIKFLTKGLCACCDQHSNEELMPPHDASPRCESGKRNHCSCDTCF